jgi:uncharacterized repeat protein (TIGR03843 family)
MAIDAREIIATGDLHITGRLLDASNATLFGEVSLPTDQDLPAEQMAKVSVIYKPIAGERPLWDFPDGTLAYREFAAYLFSEFAGFHIVPFTILREGPFGPGAVQEWITIDESVDLVELAQSDVPRLREFVLFDAIINNTDRKIGHLLPSISGELFGCDHGVCFHEEDKLRTVLWQWMEQPLNESELSQLRDAKKRFDLFVDQADSLLTAEELSATLERIDRILESQVFPVPSDNWPPVPWPPI